MAILNHHMEKSPVSVQICRAWRATSIKRSRRASKPAEVSERKVPPTVQPLGILSLKHGNYSHHWWMGYMIITHGRYIGLIYKIPSGNQTWLAGKWTIEIEISDCPKKNTSIQFRNFPANHVADYQRVCFRVAFHQETHLFNHFCLEKEDWKTPLKASMLGIVT